MTHPKRTGVEEPTKKRLHTTTIITIAVTIFAKDKGYVTLLRRNMFRQDADRDARVGACDRQALPLAEALLERGWQHQLTVEQHVFALMPLRHTPR